MGNEIGRAPFIIQRDEIHIFPEKGPKSRDQLEDIGVVWGMIKNDGDRNISRLSLQLLASNEIKANPQC
jgi:hypothetical protein